MSIAGDLLIELAAEDERERLTRFKEAWKAYHGKFPDPLRVKLGQANDNTKLNFSRLIVDKGVFYLFGKNVTFELDDQEDKRSEPEKWLDAAWNENNKMLTLQKLATNGGVCGHAFLKIVDQQLYPRLIVLDPATVHPTWDPDDIEKVLKYRIQYPAIDSRTGKPIVKRQLIEVEGQGDAARWYITDQQTREDATSPRWETIGESVWPYSWPPIVDCQNLPAPNEFWGLSDLESDIVQLNKSINFVLSNLMRIVRFHGHPKTWGKGFAAQQLDIAVDETIVLPSADASLANLEMLNDLSSSIQLYRELKEALHELSHVPAIATGKMEDVGQLSGLALQILYGPLIELTEVKRLTYGHLIKETNKRMLVLGGKGDNLSTSIPWPGLLPSDPKTDAEVALLDEQIGASQDTLLRKRGYDPDQERQKREASAKQMGDSLLSAFEKGQEDENA